MITVTVISRRTDRIGIKLIGEHGTDPAILSNSIAPEINLRRKAELH